MVPNVTVGSGATFQFDNSGTNLSSRYSALGRVTLTGGTLDLKGNATAPSSQAIGVLKLISPNTNPGGTGYVIVEPASATLTASSFVTGTTNYNSATGMVTQGVPNYTFITSYPTSLTKLGTGTLLLAGTNDIPAGVNINNAPCRLEASALWALMKSTQLL